jgi:glucose-1-phosphate cytidylyltransferase
MKILVMCGGRGRRLGTLTDRVPKPLVCLNGKTILELKIDEYLRQGCRDFIFCVGYRGDLIRETVRRYGDRISAVFSDAGEEAGILERLYHARDLFDGTVLMTYGDTFTNLSLDRLFAFHEEGGHEATLVTASIQNPFGLVEFDGRHRVTSFREKPVLQYYIGHAAIRKSALRFVPDEIRRMRDGEGLVAFFKILMAVERLGAYEHTGLEISFNTPDELKVAEEKLCQFYTMSEVEDGLEG